MKMFLKMVLLILLCQNLLSFDKFSKMSLLEYADFVSVENDINIYIDETIDKNITLIVSTDFSKSALLETFSGSLRDMGFDFIKRFDYFEIKKSESNDYFTYKLKNLNFEDIQNLLKFYDVKYQYLPASNIVVFNCKKTDFSKIEKLLKISDVKNDQLKLKLTIFSTDLTKLKQVGTDYEKFDTTIKSVFDLLNERFVGTGYYYTNTAKFDLDGVFKFLQENQLIDIIQSPIIIISHNSQSSFKSVKNIPFKMATTQISNAQSTQSQSFEYRDVGLQIDLKSKIYDDKIYLDLNLTIEDIYALSETPITNKISISNPLEFKKDEIVILSGLNRTESKDSTVGIPLLQEIPLLNPLFKYDNKETTDYIFTVILEVIP